LSAAASEKMHIMQFDVSTAFLYGQLDEEIYIENLKVSLITQTGYAS